LPKTVDMLNSFFINLSPTSTINRKILMFYENIFRFVNKFKLVKVVCNRQSQD
jgi:hypothetical protein